MTSHKTSSGLTLRIRSLLAVTAVSLGACTPFALSPPARTLPLESSATLDEGDVAIQAAGGYHEAAGRDGGAAAVRARVGVVPMLEAQLEASYAHLDYGDEIHEIGIDRGDVRSPHIGSGRIGLKVAPIEHLAFVAGFGAGTHAHGAFVAPDIAVIAAYENRVLVPWMAVRAWVSLPVDPQTVTVAQSDGNGDVELFSLVPPNTAGWQVSTGLRLPIAIDPERGLGMNVLAGVALARLHGLDGVEEIGILQVEGGIEIVVDP